MSSCLSSIRERRPRPFSSADQLTTVRMMRHRALAIAVLCISGSMRADTVVAKLTVNNPIVFIGLPGAFIQVPAASVTFMATGDTAAVYSYQGHLWRMFFAHLQQ